MGFLIKFYYFKIGKKKKKKIQWIFKINLIDDFLKFFLRNKKFKGSVVVFLVKFLEFKNLKVSINS